MGGSIGTKTVQIHLGRTCNLSCLHCYSRSGPKVTETLPTERVLDVLNEAWRQGYQRASFSGGEPMIFRDFPLIARHAKELGFATNMVTNGTLLPEETWKALQPHIDLIAISIDGPPVLHNRLRGSTTAFRRMERNLAHFRDSGIPFGFIHTVTADSLHHFEWLTDFAVQQGAALLQLHPLGLVGAAADADALPALDGEAMTRAYLAAEWLRHRHKAALEVHIDLFNRERVRLDPDLIYACDVDYCAETRLSDLINPLVLMSNGDLSPVCHGMPRRFLLGNILDGTPVETLFARYSKQDHARFRRHCAALWRALEPTLDWPYFNWFEYLERASSDRTGGTTQQHAAPLQAHSA